MVKLEPVKIQQILHLFNDSSKLFAWKVAFRGLLKTEGLDYLLLTREQMVYEIEQYGPDVDDSDNDTPYTPIPFTDPSPLKPTKPKFIPFEHIAAENIDISAVDDEAAQRAAYNQQIVSNLEKY